MCLKSSFVYKINAYRGTTTFKKMLSFEVDSLEDNLSWTISGSVLFSQRMLPFQELKEGLPKKCDLRRPSNDTDLQTCVCVCVCVCVWQKERERLEVGVKERWENQIWDNNSNMNSNSFESACYCFKHFTCISSLSITKYLIK